MTWTPFDGPNGRPPLILELPVWLGNSRHRIVQKTPCFAPASWLGARSADLAVHMRATHWCHADVPPPPQPRTQIEQDEQACLETWRTQSLDHAHDDTPGESFRRGFLAALALERRRAR